MQKEIYNFRTALRRAAKDREGESLLPLVEKANLLSVSVQGGDVVVYRPGSNIANIVKEAVS